MGSAPLVIMLVGMVFPIALLLLALVADVVVLVWAGAVLWRDKWSVQVRHAMRRVGYAPHWRVIRHH